MTPGTGMPGSVLALWIISSCSEFPNSDITLSSCPSIPPSIPSKISSPLNSPVEAKCLIIRLYIEVMVSRFQDHVIRINLTASKIPSTAALAAQHCCQTLRPASQRHPVSRRHKRFNIAPATAAASGIMAARYFRSAMRLPAACALPRRP